MRYLLVVGEASADLHASNLIQAIKGCDPRAEFAYIGGELMTKVTGIPPLMHYRDLAFMGLIPVLRNLSTIRQAGRLIQEAMRSFAPDVVIPVDYAGFNLRYVLPTARELGIPVAYYIAPKLWAWKKGRIRQLRNQVDRLLCILPFEERFFTRYGIKARYVGNPCIDATRAFVQVNNDHNLQPKPQIAILSGSRHQELSCNLPVMLRATTLFAPQYRVVIAGAPSLTSEDYAPYLAEYPEVELRFGETYNILAESKAALVTSGTATLEAALIGCPMVVCYRMGGQRWLRWAWKYFFSVPFISLVNLILDRSAVPELIGGEVSETKLSDLLADLLTESETRAAQIQDFAELRVKLGDEPASNRVALAIMELLKEQGHPTLPSISPKLTT
ncbi:MAG: lipid-A-disaccharide synthase [Porphyromonadaceae bacterium]|nr:lipid-A-disaccharide synthase [Porphyromonadaceae bacterium]